MDLTLRTIDSLSDPHLAAWLELYELAFPPEERVPAPALFTTLQPGGPAGPRQAWCLAAESQGKLVGLAQVSWFSARRTAYLGYLAVQPALRGQGIGSLLYRRLRAWLMALQPRLLLFDVEYPAPNDFARDIPQYPAPGDLADAPDLRWRRIRFYQRLGAGLLRGLLYQWGEPPLTQYLMAHPLQAGLSTQDVLASARPVIASFDAILVAEPGVERVELVFG